MGTGDSGNIQLQATVLPSDATDKTVAYTTDAEGITVSADGLVSWTDETAFGTYTVTATTVNGLTDEFELTLVANNMFNNSKMASALNTYNATNVTQEYADEPTSSYGKARRVSGTTTASGNGGGAYTSIQHAESGEYYWQVNVKGIKGQMMSIGYQYSTSIGRKLVELTGDWQIVTNVFTASNPSDANFTFYIQGNSLGFEYYIHSPIMVKSEDIPSETFAKLEQGNVATQYTVAPEDL